MNMAYNQRPTAVTVIAIMNIVLGSLAVLFSLALLVFSSLMTFFFFGAGALGLILSLIHI